MSHSTTQSKDYTKSDIMVDSLIILNGKNNHYFDYNVPKWLSIVIYNVEFQV